MYKRNTQLFHRGSHRFRGKREGWGERGRDEWIRIILIVAGVYRVPAHFPIFGLRVYSYARLFHSGGGRLFDGGKKSDRSFVSDFLKLLDGSRWKIGLQNFPDRFLLSNAWKESSTNRLVFLLIDTFWSTDKTREKGEIRRRRYFFSRPLVVEEKNWRKENESRGTKEREERTNSSQTIKTNDPVAPLVHPFTAKINCGMTTDPTKWKHGRNRETFPHHRPPSHLFA